MDAPVRNTPQLEENIRVAVRVRPLNEDERQSGQVCIHRSLCARLWGDIRDLYDM